jgi:DNA-binding beta-propeller fold protein YncE
VNQTRPVISALVAALLLVAGACGAGSAQQTSARRVSHPSPSPRDASLTSPGVHHYEYVFPDQQVYVYDIDHRHRLVEHFALPGIRGIRGVAASPTTHVLYISHGGDGGPNGNGSLLAYDLVTGRILWDRTYSRGIDSMAVDAAGARIYMPDGELSGDGTWTVLDARSGQPIGAIAAGAGAHNTIVGPSGRRVYLGGRNYPYLDVADTVTSRVIERIGPLRSGVRPFTINGSETLAFTTATGFLGFQVNSILTGRVLDTVTFGSRFRWDPARFGPSAPSHGISLSPDERQVWVIDAPNSYVHVFGVAGLPGRAPRPIADIKLQHGLTGSEAGCSYDCARDGWLQHSSSGCFVYVGDSGDVLSGSSLRVVAFLPPLRDTRKMLEIDWRQGLPVGTTSRSGLGYVAGRLRPPRPRCG